LRSPRVASTRSIADAAAALDAGDWSSALYGQRERVARPVELTVQGGGAARDELGAGEVALGKLRAGEIERRAGAHRAGVAVQRLLDLAPQRHRLGDLALAQQALGERAAILDLRERVATEQHLRAEVAVPQHALCRRAR
jgi:hypothetical protein